jgi:hypothetical protein
LELLELLETLHDVRVGDFFLVGQAIHTEADLFIHLKDLGFEEQSFLLR